MSNEKVSIFIVRLDGVEPSYSGPQPDALPLSYSLHVGSFLPKNSVEFFVVIEGFEPPISCVSSKRFDQLSYMTMEPPIGLEPITYCLQGSRSTWWAKAARFKLWGALELPYDSVAVRAAFPLSYTAGEAFAYPFSSLQGFKPCSRFLQRALSYMLQRSLIYMDVSSCYQCAPQ